MPSRSPFVMSTFQDTGIQVAYVEGDGDQTSSNSGDASVTFSSVDVDNLVVAFAVGRNVSPTDSGTATTYSRSFGSSTLTGYGGTDYLNAAAGWEIDTSGSVTISSGGGGKGGAVAAVVLQDGFDLSSDSAYSGNSVSISNCDPKDVLLYWQATQDSSTIPAVPSGFTTIASGVGYSGQGGGGNIPHAYVFAYKDNPSGTESYSIPSTSTPSAGELVRVYRVLKNYELSSYGSPDYTITSFPSTGTGVASGANDLLVAVDTTISHGGGANDEGLFLEMGGAGAGFAWGLDNATTMRARGLDGGGSFRDGGTDALAAADVQQSITRYRNRQCTFYVRVDASATQMRLYVQPGGQNGPYPIRTLEINTSNGAYTANVYGSAGKGYGQVNGVCTDLVGSGGTGAYEDNYTGTIDEIRYWGEAGAPDISGFSNTYDTV